MAQGLTAPAVDREARRIVGVKAGCTPDPGGTTRRVKTKSPPVRADGLSAGTPEREDQKPAF